jgi:hypothetical protein
MLPDLRSRVAEALGPDRDLDASLYAFAVGWDDASVGADGYAYQLRLVETRPDSSLRYEQRGGRVALDDLPHYTASLRAALAFVESRPVRSAAEVFDTAFNRPPFAWDDGAPLGPQLARAVLLVYLDDRIAADALSPAHAPQAEEQG